MKYRNTYKYKNKKKGAEFHCTFLHIKENYYSISPYSHPPEENR